VISGEVWLAVIAFSAVGSLLAFLIFNWNPAKIFPGDSLTYGIGALIAVIAILGNMEKIGVILFLPFIIDALWSLMPEAKGGKKVEAFGRVNKDNSLEMPYERMLSFEHFGIYAVKKLKKKVYETDVTLFFLVMELALSLLIFLFFV
jgi:UDP-N-acetylglucosamine--dolichyl-phosphate N-acetylglucosaminephosphotransferase